MSITNIAAITNDCLYSKVEFDGATITTNLPHISPLYNPEFAVDGDISTYFLAALS